MPGITGHWPEAFGHLSEEVWSGIRTQARVRQLLSTATAWASANSATATPWYLATGYSNIQGAWSASSALSASGVRVQQYYDGMTGTGGNDSGTAVYESLFGASVTGAFDVSLVADYVRFSITNGAAPQARFIFGAHLKVLGG